MIDDTVVNDAADNSTSGVSADPNFVVNPEDRTIEEPKIEESKIEEPPIEPEKPDPEAINDRLRRQNSRQAKLISALGLDPTSDLDEQLENGLITPEMLRAHLASRYAPQTAAAPQAPQTTQGSLEAAAAEQKAALEAYNKEVEETGSVSLQTNNRLRQADIRVNDARLEQLTQQITAKDKSEQDNKSVAAVLETARSTPEYIRMEPTMQKTVDDVSLSLTGLIADREVRGMGINPATLNAQQYKYFAGKASESLGKLAEYYRQLGRDEVKKSLLPKQPNNRPNQPLVNPANNAGEPAGAPNPYERVTVRNHKEAARQFARAGGIV